LIRGNHDSILGPIAKKKNIELKEYYKVNDILICHGNKIIEEESKIIIIGHDHPTIGLREDSRVEVFKCFLKGEWEGKTMIVMPSSNLVTQGSDVLRETLLSPYLKNIDDFKIYVVDEKIYDFGKVKELK